MEVSAPLLAFPSFPQLPLELQIKIYNLLANEPRTVQIHELYKCVLPTILNPIHYLVCHDPVPVVLHICQLSRTEAKTA